MLNYIPVQMMLHFIALSCFTSSHYHTARQTRFSFQDHPITFITFSLQRIITRQARTKVSFQRGMKRLTTQAKDSVTGSTSSGISLYLASLRGWNSLSFSMGGGGVAYDRLQMSTWSAPCFSTVCVLSRPAVIERLCVCVRERESERKRERERERARARARLRSVPLRAQKLARAHES
jgi:hypothetical protein